MIPPQSGQMMSVGMAKLFDGRFAFIVCSVPAILHVGIFHGLGRTISINILASDVCAGNALKLPAHRVIAEMHLAEFLEA
jgi:hypothetical protein